MKFLKHGPEIVVGTPGRVIDLLDRRIINFDNVRFVVLDEVDRMLDIGFRDDIRNILSRVKGHARNAGTTRRERQDDRTATARAAAEASSPEPRAPHQRGHQTIFVSATITDEIEQPRPRVHARAGREAHRPRRRREADRREGRAVLLLAPAVGQVPAAQGMLLERENPDLAIVFCRTKHGARKARQASCTPTASSAARSTATSPRTSATGS